jgi:hypothetical protein
MMPDRMTAHYIPPGCEGQSEMCGYLKREWAADPAILGQGKVGGKERSKAARRPSFLRRIIGVPTRLMIWIHHR